MKTILILMLSISAVFNYQEKDSTQVIVNSKEISAQKTSGDLEFLRDMADKYPHEVNLLQNKIIKERLVRLLGDRFEFIKDISELGPSTPIEVTGNIFSSYTCQQHNCTFTNFIVVADIAKNLFYAGIREEEQVKIYSEDESDPPQVLKDWAKK